VHTMSAGGRRASVRRAVGAAAVALLLSACGGTSSGEEVSAGGAGERGNTAFAGFPLEITDAAGQTHTFDEPPAIGCYWYGCIEMLADLGVPQQATIAAEEELDQAFYHPADPPVHVLTDGENPEEWARAEVDVILTRVPEDPGNDALEQAAPVFYLHHPSYGDSGVEGVDAYYENMRLIGQLAGDPDGAEEAIERYESFVAAVKEAAPDDAADLTVAPLFASDDGSYNVSGTENPFCDVLADEDLGTCVDVRTGEVNPEAFLALDPDWIPYMVFADDSETWADRDDAVWGRLRAVQEEQIYDAGHRIYCCSLRGLTHSLQQYAHHVFGEEGGIPDPGPLPDFNPVARPLQPAG
jgi:ABC-type Fe3+-hydroxamate transport system substrate-binding protein